MRSEHKGCDDDEETVRTPWRKSILGDAVLYCSSDDFEEEINNFKRNNAHIFAQYAESKHSDDMEHKLECTEAFNEYQNLIESLLEDFTASKGSTVKEFYAECRSSIEGGFTALFEDHEHKWFVDALLSWLDYSHFFEDMVRASRMSHK
mmetsp:Transcript_19993/g.28724  ORF Transcript_19993/g.28724 Transcript_19993/m.28724 type:complete len:149 (+) Transcript_19993:70-516(+)